MYPHPTQSLQCQWLLIKVSERNSLNNTGVFFCLFYSYSKVVSVTKLTLRGVTRSSEKHNVRHFYKETTAQNDGTLKTGDVNEPFRHSALENSADGLD